MESKQRRYLIKFKGLYETLANYGIRYIAVDNKVLLVDEEDYDSYINGGCTIEDLLVAYDDVTTLEVLETENLRKATEYE